MVASRNKAEHNHERMRAAAPFQGPELYINRELSWLHFNQRVLDEALRKDSHPLLERVKFISIFSSNLDEYFMIRVAGIEDQFKAGIHEKTIDGFTPTELLAHIRFKVEQQLQQRNRCFYDDLVPALHEAGIEFVTVNALSPEEQLVLSHYFRREVYPVLTPLAIDTGHPFPFMSNLSLNLAIELEDESSKVMRFARVKVPDILPRLLRLDQIPGCEVQEGQIRFIWIEDLIQSNLDQLFPRMRIVQSQLFRLIRDADIEIEKDEAGDLLKTMEKGLRSRRYGKVVRLDITPDMPQPIQQLLCDNLGIEHRNVYEIDGALGFACLLELLKLDRLGLKDDPFIPRNRLNDMAGHDLFRAVRLRDRLLYHPYDSFQPVVDFIEQAANDPKVLTIKQTLYRVGTNSPIVRALMRAAENGKQVAVLVELKARFDEKNNIVWAKALEDVGVHVVYGLPVLKTHAKLTLIVRREQQKIKRYLHMGTGNYNPSTGKIYTDYSLFTVDETLANEVAELFNSLTGYSHYSEYRQLLVSPLNTRSRIIAMIERERAIQQHGGQGRIILKMNALVDLQIIHALYHASCDGVRIDLIIRGICCLKPGIPGVSEHIRVISIIGRFLEHSRAYYFFNGGQEELYLGSADLMPRNLDDRVEVLFPVYDRILVAEVSAHLELMLQDTVKAWEMQPDGKYRLLHAKANPVNSQQCFIANVSEQHPQPINHHQP